MGWRNIISREALGGSLESFGPATWPLRTGANQSVSKIKVSKLPNFRQITSLAQATTRAVDKNVKSISQIFATPTPRRLVLHGTALVAVALVVATGNSTGSHLGTRLVPERSAGYGAVLDTASALTVAATVAQKTALPVAIDASKTAKAVNAQVALPTDGNDALAKRQVVATAGTISKDPISYHVGDGDTLSGIASKFNITTATVQWANNLSNADAIKPGQTLTILPISGLLYTVAAGDTPATLATKYQANAAQITSFNNAEVKGLQLGQRIIIPDGIMPGAPAPAAAATAVATSSSKGTKLLSALPRVSFSANGYAFGYCTYYVASRRYVPTSWGNANSWYYDAQYSGYKVGSAPAAGAIAWTGAGYYGHVAYVEKVQGGQVEVSEMNYNGGWDRVDTRWASAGEFRYIY